MPTNNFGTGLRTGKVYQHEDGPSNAFSAGRNGIPPLWKENRPGVCCYLSSTCCNPERNPWMVSWLIKPTVPRRKVVSLKMTLGPVYNVTKVLEPPVQLRISPSIQEA